MIDFVQNNIDNVDMETFDTMYVITMQTFNFLSHYVDEFWFISEPAIDYLMPVTRADIAARRFDDFGRDCARIQEALIPHVRDFTETVKWMHMKMLLRGHPRPFVPNANYISFDDLPTEPREGVTKAIE